MDTDDKLQAYRQPMVTATGIILGFILNFAPHIEIGNTPIVQMSAYFAAACLIVGSISLVVVLFRILQIDYPRNRAKQYYNWTLFLFLFGICLALFGVFVEQARFLFAS
jgi:hypothetical protein